jgi:hypothetical protein
MVGPFASLPKRLLCTSRDSTQLLYLRARYYNPANGRFVNKDPSRMENNLYSYARGNPVNRIDPSGFYSKEMIRNSIDPMEFESDGFFDDKNHSHWGFYSLLLNAQDGDYIQAGSLDVMASDVSFSSGEGFQSWDCKIWVGGKPLKQYFDNVVKRQRYPEIWWRDTSPMFYDLFSLSTYPNSRQSFVDGLDFGRFNDIPQFHGLSRGYGNIEVQVIVDINGNFHLALSGGGPGKTYGLGYLEGYLCTLTWNNLGEGCFDNIPSPSEVTSAIDGVCLLSTELILVGGINISPLCAGTHLRTEGNYTSLSTFYVGAGAGSGFGGSVTFPLGVGDPSLGWKWALDDQKNGVTFSDILATVGLP